MTTSHTHDDASRTDHAHPRRLSGRTRRFLVIGLLAALGLGGIGIAAAMLTGFLPNPVVAGDPNASGLDEPNPDGPQPVKAVRPQRDPNFRITTRQFAVIEPYYQAGLRPRVSGEVRYVAKAIGEQVRAGEVLVEIDVPDLRQAVDQKSALIVQRERELIAAEADYRVAQSMVEAARVAVRQKKVEVSRANDVRLARKTDRDRVAALVESGSLLKDRLDSIELDYHAAERTVEAAEAEVERARVDEVGKSASLAKAAADVELKRALVEVAREDREAAAIQLSYTQLRAPFDGVIVAGAPSPGKFVSAGAGEPLVTVARTDMVTVVVKVPDNAAAFVSNDTEVLVEFAQLPGVTARGRVTRFSPSIDPSDRTMRVEVDVYNGSGSEYQAMMSRGTILTGLAPLIANDRLAGIAGAAGSVLRQRGDSKGAAARDVLIPDWGPEGKVKPIVPGTIATVRLELEKFSGNYLLPSSAVYGKAGQFYILVVQDGVTKAVPVAVQMNDGTLAKVATLLPGSGRQVTRELTGNEIVVSARQLEVGEGVRVTPTFDER